ncbi:MAG: acetyl-CoA carboxylase biotin carboxyl carrier protein subunit [Algibacter sp.]
MNKVFKVNVNSLLDFEINTDAISKLDTLQISDTDYHIIQDNHSIKATVLQSDFLNKSYKVNINNTTYNILINNKLDSLIKDMGFTTRSIKQVNSIKAPMPGLIIDISVTIHQEVKENEPLLILEAMKMENIITSPKDGIIKSITAKKGDAVEKNQLLIEFEK